MTTIYKLGPIRQTTDATNGSRFDVVGVIGKPLVHLAFETREQAEKARMHTRAAVRALAVEMIPRNELVLW
jgi:hypothetical protein